MVLFLSVLCSIYHITAAIELIPSIVRMCQRRSSYDFSLVTTVWKQ